MSASKLDAVKAIRNRLRAPTADERIELVTQMVTAIERDHPDLFPEVLDIVIGVYEASDKFVKEVQTPANKPTVASPICEDESLTRAVPTNPLTWTSRLIEPSGNGVRHSYAGALEKADPKIPSWLAFKFRSAEEEFGSSNRPHTDSGLCKTAQVTKTSKAAKRAGDDSMAKEPKKAKIAKKASGAKPVVFKDGGQDDDDCSA
ncbi:hypothetical protein SLS54_008118 [Diplodia seriata]